MPKELRAELHESSPPGSSWPRRAGVVEYEEILGYHLEQAYGYRTELAPVDDRRDELEGSRRASRVGRAEGTRSR